MEIISWVLIISLAVFAIDVASMRVKRGKSKRVPRKRVVYIPRQRTRE